MILNEISTNMHGCDIEDVKKQLSNFLHVCHELFDQNGDKSFYYADSMMVEPLTEDYTIHDWLKDANVPKKEKDFWRRLINSGAGLHKSDFLQSEVILNIDNNPVSSIGCLAAYESNSYVISFSSREIWKANKIEGKYITLQGEDLDIYITNVSDISHVNKMHKEEKMRTKLHISSGKELWEKRRELFPHLVFCDSVRKQLDEARVSLQIQSIMKRIQILEDYFEIYDGNFQKEKVGYGCRYESESVQNDEYLKNLRKFKTPYGKEEYFYWHISFPGNYPGRIHFIPDEKQMVGIIGYIGKHLPTKKHSTI
ncbi:MAG: hypothetical protein K2I10_01010 [Lachnospiraceae bacterium]|nr:hypothetical protein [Lachnospiraceae bacterium]